jgi:hypothetical protein
MTCNEAQQLLTAYADNALDAANRQDVEKHLEDCRECRRELEEIHQLLAAIEQSAPEVPGTAIRENFTAMLQAEINILATENLVQEQPAKKSIYIRMQSTAWRAAAACIILGVGIWIGTKMNNGGVDANVVAELQREIKDVKETAMVNMLDDESASQRLQAVSYADSISNPNQKVTDALINTLNNDKSVNVRLAALYSLARFNNSKSVNDSLVASLERQTEPIIQVVLINILVEKKETKAIQPIRQLLQNGKTLKEVKDAAQKGLKAI